MNTKFDVKHRGMTLAGILIVIMVLGILAAMMMFSSNEAITTAKATKIIANLQILKRAAIEWYTDNQDRVVKFDMKVNGSDAKAGMVIVNNRPKPIQECSEKDLQLGRYLGHVSIENFNIHTATKPDPNTGNVNTNLKEGSYGICDGGTIVEPNGFDDNGKPKYKTTAYHRSSWYVGYCFTQGEAAVREKIKGRMKLTGVFLGTADAHEDNYNDNSAAVWLRVF